MSLAIEYLNIQGSANLKLFRHTDIRGDFTPIFRDEDFLNQDFDFTGIKNVYLSNNNKKGTLRGFHRQKGSAAESKLITCLNGKAIHILLRIQDKRIYLAENYLSYKTSNATFVPRDCYSAFLTLEPYTQLLYLTDNNYIPSKGEGIRWDDPLLNAIKWPIKPTCFSKQDLDFPNIKL